MRFIRMFLSVCNTEKFKKPVEVKSFPAWRWFSSRRNPRTDAVPEADLGAISAKSRASVMPTMGKTTFLQLLHF